MGGGDLALRGGDFLSVTVWIVVAFFLLSPVLLWRWREDGRKQGFWRLILGGKRHLGINLPSPPLRCEKCDEQCGSDSASRFQ
jgi:hypothetical protein